MGVIVDAFWAVWATSVLFVPSVPLVSSSDVCGGSRRLPSNGPPLQIISGVRTCSGRKPRPMIRAVYLVAQAVIPVFLSFVFILATRPLYTEFARSKEVIGLRPLNDQQVSGFESKLAFLITLLIVAGVILARAPDSDDDLGPEDPLVWADIERHFERIDRRGRPVTDTGALPASGPAPAPGQPPGAGDLAARPPGDGEGGPDEDSPTE